MVALHTETAKRSTSLFVTQLLSSQGPKQYPSCTPDLHSPGPHHSILKVLRRFEVQGNTIQNRTQESSSGAFSICRLPWWGGSWSLSTVTENFILTSVVVTMSADGLHVLVSGGTVPTLLRTGEPGPGPAVLSEQTEDELRWPLFWILLQALLIVSANSQKSWT